MLNVKQGSSEYQFLSHCFNQAQNRTPSLPLQMHNLYILVYVMELIKRESDTAILTVGYQELEQKFLKPTNFLS